ncbi:tudor and KH domain-containing protein isoform X2 [Lithobates pipiens]
MAGWSNLSTRQKVALALGVSAGAAVLCVCYAKYRSGQAPKSAEDTDELRMKISQHAVKRLPAGEDEVIGQLSKRTSTRIDLSQVIDSDGRQELTIRGSPAQVRQAQELLPGILRDDAVIEVELHLPARSVCRIIGKGGQRIREMSKTSGANIQCERQPDNCLDLARCITITGSLKQVEAAKTLIQKVVEEDASIWKNPAVSSNFRSHRKTIIAVKKKDKQPPAKEGATPSTGSPDSFHTADSPEERIGEDSEPQNIANATFNIYKFEVPSPDFNFRAGEHVEVCVSATENPKHFWIQILGSRASQLDKLTTEMSDFYLRQKKQGEMPEIQNGDIVAAPFHDDGFWYRAEVLGLPENGTVDLYYVDYGDNWACPKEHLFPLRSDFLSLPFQAVECGLAYVSPNGGKWSSEALDVFDTLVHCAKWKPLLAKIASFPSPGVSHFQIQLYDPSRDPMLDIGQELIRLGLAVEQGKSPVKSDDDETIVSRLLAEVTSMSEKPEPTSFAKLQEEEHRLESEILNSSSDDVIVVEPNDA